MLFTFMRKLVSYIILLSSIYYGCSALRAPSLEPCFPKESRDDYKLEISSQDTLKTKLDLSYYTSE